MAPPNVFISYSHDSSAHEAKVLAFANRLRADGIDAILDQYEEFPKRGWIHWMKQRVRDANFILVICTATYRRRWDGEERIGQGLGATYESGLVQQLLYDAGGVNERFVPVLLGEKDDEHIPLELRRYTHFRPYNDKGYEKLYQYLTNQPTIEKPVLAGPLPTREAQPDFRNVFWKAPARNPFFTGRTKHLEDIRETFLRTASPTQSLSITGMGGVGKTQTAIEYAHLYRAIYSAVFWCGADSQAALLSGFADIAQILELPQKDNPDLNIVTSAVSRWLELNSGWLLVLDNVEDLPLIRQFVPANAAGHTLITTRSRASGEFAEPLELGKMMPDEGALLLLRRSRLVDKDRSPDTVHDADRTLARQFSKEVDGLPLALDQAGAFIEETPSTLSEYLKLYRTEGAALRARRGELVSSHSSVTTTFSVAIAAIARADPTAAELVRACAFLAPNAIPEEVFTRAAEQWGEPIANVASKPLGWTDAMREASKFALIHRIAKDETLEIHRLVQEVARDEMSMQTRLRWAEAAIRALDAIFPEVAFENWIQCERLIPHVRTAADIAESLALEFLEEGRLLHHAAWYLYERARYKEAEPLCQRSLKIREKILGPDDPQVAQSLNNLALLHSIQGKYTEAEPLYRRSLGIREKALDPDDPDLAESLNNLAGLYRNQGDYAEAEPLYRRSLAILERAVGPDHPDVATSLNNLAKLYQIQARFAEAEPLYRRSLAIWEKALGPDHPKLATGLNDLAELYRGERSYTKAEPLYQRSQAIWEKSLGPDHPYLAISLNNLALLYDAQGKYGEAEPHYKRSLEIFEKALGSDHPYVAASLNNLAFLYTRAKMDAEAEPLYQRSLTIRERSLGPDHPYVAESLNNLAELYRGRGRYVEAEPLYRRSLAIWEKTLGSDHPNVATSLNNLGLLYDAQAEYTEADPLYQRSLAIREKALGPDHPETKSVRSRLQLLHLMDHSLPPDEL